MEQKFPPNWYIGANEAHRFVQFLYDKLSSKNMMLDKNGAKRFMEDVDKVIEEQSIEIEGVNGSGQGSN